MQFKYFIEGETYEKFDIDNDEIEKNFFDKTANGKVILKFSGITYSQGLTYIFFPKGFKIKNHNSEDEIILNAELLLKTIKKYKNNINNIEFYDEWLSDNENFNIIKTAEWLIRDFKRNGFYIEDSNKREVNGKGKILWGQTIKKKIPFLRNSTIIYNELITEKNNIDFDSDISKIHKFVMIDCIRKFGWLFDINIPYQNITLVLNRNQCMGILKRKLLDTFKDREKRLLINIIKYLELIDNENAIKGYVTPYFYWIWEEMLKNIFDHDVKLEKYVPHPFWEINNNKYYTNQIPDILTRYYDDVIILDAKYYKVNFKNSNYLPGWESIVKQLYYKDTFAKNLNVIGNFFVLPYSDYERKHNFIGKVSVDGLENKYGYIYAYTYDVTTAMEYYLEQKKDRQTIEDFLNNLEN